MNALRRITIAMLTGANAATIALLWLCAGVTYISPETAPRLSLLTLAFPIFLAADALFAVVWLAVRWQRLWIPLVGIVAVWPQVHSYIPLHLPTRPSSDALHVLTYNTHGYGSKAANYDAGNIVLDYIADSDADIIFLQESFTRGRIYKNYAKRFRQQGLAVLEGKQQVIITRLPVIDHSELHLDADDNKAMTARLQWGSDTLLIVNIHLESNQLSQQVKDAYIEAIDSHDGDSIGRGILPLMRLISHAAPHRARQTDSLAAYVAAWLPRPVIIAGDCNDTPVSYTLRQLSRGMASAYAEAGTGPGVTFKERGFPVRIDHVLYAPQHFRSIHACVDHTATASDHYPLHAYLMPLQRKQE